MIWGLAAIVALIWVGRKFRPAHLGDDILKLELFRHLHFRNARDAAEHMSFEDLEKRLWTRVLAFLMCEFACMSLSLKAMGLTWTWSAWISLSLALTSLVIWVRRTTTYRQTTLPLFATLCRIPQNRWDMRARPKNWVRVDLNKGRVWIRLPKDWNATRPVLKSIGELVNARVPGTWVMEADTRKFLLTFRREVDAETVLVTGTQNEDDNEPATLTWEMEEKETDNGPW